MEEEASRVADPRLFAFASIDPEESHSAIAQFLEHMLAGCLSSFRGSEAAERQKRLVDRILETLVDELGADAIQRFSIATPLRRLLAIHAAARDTPLERPDTPLARSALLTGTRLDPSLGGQLC